LLSSRIDGIYEWSNVADYLGKRRVPGDVSKVGLTEQWEIDYWAEELGINEARLREIIALAGDGAAAIRQHLSRTTESRFDAKEPSAPDDCSKLGPEDRSQINLTKASELAYWAEELNVSEEILRSAIHQVGNRTDAVREFLKSNS
jgi:hypothetical protein